MSNSPRKRVLMLIANLGYGGAEGSFLRLANHISNNFDVTIAVMAKNYGGDSYSESNIACSLPIIILDGGRIFRFGPIGKALRWFQMFRKFRELKSNHNVSISFLSGPNLLNSLVGSKEKTILSERGSKKFDTGRSVVQAWIWNRILDPLAYRGAAYIVAASKGLASEIMLAYPSIAKRIKAIEGAIVSDDLTKFANFEVEPEFLEFLNYPTIITYGRLHHQKGFDALLRVFVGVKKVIPNARLLFIGDGPQFSALASLSNTLGFRTGFSAAPNNYDVIFAGYRDHPIRYLKVGKVFAFSSRYEGLPNALIEAVAAGIQILAADCPWGPKSILSGRHDEKNLGMNRLPLQLEFGTLLPLIDSIDGVILWEKALVTALEKPFKTVRDERTMSEIRRFDIKNTCQKWVVLINDLNIK